MIRCGWLVDEPSHAGGAELTVAEFRAAAPEGVEIVDCPPEGVVSDLDFYVIHNNVQYSLADMQAINRPCLRYWHDVGPWLEPDVRRWLNKRATPVCCSPVQAEHMGIQAICVPPAVDLSRFTEAASRTNGNRAGIVSVGSWRNYGKAPHKAAEWAGSPDAIDFVGSGPFAPVGSVEVSYNDMPDLLARYETFVHLPSVLEPFGRAVAEAWAAGCRVVTNGLVGAGWWIREDPDAIETAGEDFWAVVLR